MSKFIEESDGIENPYAFIQWKGTDVCMDFHCECGAHCHFDGYFAYTVKCPHCETIWEMPTFIVPRRPGKSAEEWHVSSAKMLEPDEDYSDEVEGPDGITRMVPHQVRD